MSTAIKDCSFLQCSSQFMKITLHDSLNHSRCENYVILIKKIQIILVVI
ncbi:hypothetical protein J535_3596 [Acinetobacter baumannii 1429530]|nr:hypothetical protein J535_3596 [Acinetobacter baumannii 1429530]